MKIVYIHQHFCTHKGSSGTRSYDVSKNMIDSGHEVCMICGIAERSGLKKLPWYRLFKRINIDGIDVIICNVFSTNSYGKLRRFTAFIWFAILATFAALRVKKPDLVFATSTPLTVGIPGYIAAKIKRAPFVFEVRDIWPESWIRSGWVTGKELYVRLLAKLESFLYAKAVKILLVSLGFERRLIERGFPAEKMKTIPLGANGDIFEGAEPDEDWLKKYGLTGKKIAIYTGAHGKANGLDYMLDAADFAKDDKSIAFVLIGKGAEKERLKERAESEGLNNVIFADAVVKTELPGVLAACNFGLMLLKDIGEPRPVTPNKIFDYMFMAMPAIVNFEGPTWDIVCAEDCGVFADPKNPQDLADKVKMLAADPDMCGRMGENGKKIAWEKYDRKSLTNDILNIFQEVITDWQNKKK